MIKLVTRTQFEAIMSANPTAIIHLDIEWLQGCVEVSQENLCGAWDIEDKLAVIDYTQDPKLNLIIVKSPKN